jgi:hypothetical protein
MLFDARPAGFLSPIVLELVLDSLSIPQRDSRP